MSAKDGVDSLKMLASQYLIRDANDNDANGINRVCIEAYEEFRSVIGTENWIRMRETLEQASELTRDGELIVAVDEASTVLGLVLYVPPEAVHGKTPIASIRSLSVSPSQRGKGIGRNLTEECINRARNVRAAAITLTTADMMTVARPMYERMGFVKDSDLGLRFGVQHARYVLRLR